MSKDFSVMDWVHYGILFGYFMFSTPYFQGGLNGVNVYFIGAQFVGFVILDKLLHKVLRI
jgi:hypothetical protein